MSNIRASQIFISRGTRRALSIIARSEASDASADSVGERLLSETIEKSYPALVALQKQIDAIEEKMVESVKEGK